jgi:hypothetical protein
MSVVFIVNLPVFVACTLRGETNSSWRRGITYASKRAVNLDLDNLALNDLGLLLDAHANGSAERLGERLGLAECEREDLGGSDHGEWYVSTQLF